MPRTLRFETATRFALLTILAFGRTANAQQAPEPIPILPWGPNGTVRAMSIAGDVLTIGGDFTHVGPPTGSFATTDPAGTGVVARSGMRSPIAAIESDGAGGWFVAPGSFIFATRATDELTHVLPDGTRDPNWRAPYFSDKVEAILRVGTRLFVAGSFYDNPAFAQRGVVALDAATGALLAWNAQLGGTLPYNTVRRLAATGNRLYLLGEFASVGGQPRQGLAAVDVETGAVLPTVFPTVFAFNVGSIAASASAVYVSGTCKMTDTAEFQGFCAYAPDGAPLPGWNPVPRDYGRLLATGDRLYAAVSPSAASPDYRVLALSLATGAELGWSSPPLTEPRFPGLPGGPLPGFVGTMALDGTRLYVGGRFQHVGDIRRPGVAAFNVSSGALEAWEPAVGGLVTALAADGTRVAVGGQFKSAGGVRRRGLAAIDLRTGRLATVQPPELPGVTALATRGDLVVAAGGDTVIGFAASSGAELGRLTVTGGAFAAAIHDRTLYVGGHFASVNGVERQHLAAIDLTTGQLLPWNPRPNDSVLRLEVSSGALYATGRFTAFPGVGRGGVSAFDVADLSLLSWNPQSSGVNDLGFFRERVLLGGFLQPAVGVRGTEWTDRITGGRLDFGRPTQFNVQGIGRSGDTLVVGGDPYGNWSTANLMAMNAATGQTLAWAPRLADTSFSSISAVEGNAEYVAVAGVFDDVDGGRANNLAVFRASRAGAPERLTASVVNSSVTLRWQTGPPPATLGFVVEAGTAPGARDLGVFNVGTARQMTSVLQAGTYYVRVRSIGPTGPGSVSSDVALTVPATPTVPDAPGELIARSQSGGLLLRWNAAMGNPTSYIIEGGTTSGASDLGVVNTGNLDTLFSAGVPSGTYFVRVRAVNTFGQSAPSNEITVVVP